MRPILSQKWGTTHLCSWAKWAPLQPDTPPVHINMPRMLIVRNLHYVKCHYLLLMTQLLDSVIIRAYRDVFVIQSNYRFLLCATIYSIFIRGCTSLHRSENVIYTISCCCSYIKCITVKPVGTTENSG